MLARLLLFFVLFSAAAVYADGVIDSDQLEKALELEPQPKTRGLTRGISVQVKAKVDLNIPFEYNSGALAPEAESQLLQLAEALARDSLAAYRFEVAGHTDASGSAEYNRRLSVKRAESVVRFLANAGIDSGRMIAMGYGEERLLRDDDPTHADNRRVEIRNLGTSDDVPD